MKELGITKGECKVDRHPHIDSSNRAVYRVSTYRIPTKEELRENAKMIEDSINTVQKTNLLPSELFERYNEAIEVLENIKKVIKHHTHNITDENQNQWEVVEVSDIEAELEQTISKANGK